MYSDGSNIANNLMIEMCIINIEKEINKVYLERYRSFAYYIFCIAYKIYHSENFVAIQ